METKGSFVLLSKVVASNKYFIDACLLEDTAVTCINRSTKKRKLMPFKVLFGNNNRFWLQTETWDYFFSQDEIAKINERIAKFTAQWDPAWVEIKPDEPETETPKTEKNKDAEGWGKKYEEFASLPEGERIKRMQACKSRLDALITQRPRQEQLITEALVETTQDAVLNNYAEIMSIMNLAGEDAKKRSQNLVETTQGLVKASSQLISENIFNNELMHTLVSKSNGTIIQHMTRVYLKGLAFLSYYNKLVSSSSLIDKLRISFDEDYYDFYHSLLPHVHTDDLTLLKVFHGGMRAVPENVFHIWAVGFLLHDIGKAAAVEYHEGESAYNRDIVVEHVNVGYTAILNKTNYPREAALITGYHHEYYGDPTGYGYYRSFLEQYKKTNPNKKMEACVSYGIQPVINCEAMAFFPAKLLEIVDVFDSLTDPNRKYKKTMSTEEALAIMRKEFVEKHPKLDAILFDIFVKFLREPSPS